MANHGKKLNRKRPLETMFHENRKWWIKKTKKDFKEIVCAGSDGWKCTLKGKITNDGTWHVPDDRLHQHLAYENLQAVSLIEEELYTSTVHSYAKVKAIYDKVQLNHGPHGVALLPWSKPLSNKMNSWRASKDIKNQESYVDMHNLFESMEWKELLTYTEGSVRLSSVTSTHGLTSLVYGDPTFLQKISRDPGYKLSFIFDTNTLPNLDNTRYVLVISAVYKTYTLPFSFCYFKELNTDIIKDTLAFCRDNIIIHHTPPLELIIDCDYRLREAIKNVYPGIDIGTTYYSMVMTIYHKTLLQNTIDLKNTENEIILRKILILPWLPADLIQRSFAELKILLTGDHEKNFSQLMDWFQDGFLNVFLPEEWSCYKKNHLFTNTPYTVPKLIEDKIFHANETRQHKINQFKYYEGSLDVIADSKRNLSKLSEGDKKIQLATSVKFQIPVIINDNHKASHRAPNYLWNLLGNIQAQLSVSRFSSIASRAIQQMHKLIMFQKKFSNYSIEPFDSEFTPHLERIPLPIVERHDELFDQQTLDDYILNNPHLNHNNENQEQDKIVDPVEEVENHQPYGWKCQQCFEKTSVMICKPCNCISLCEECVANIRNQEGEMQCPLCKKRATTFEKVFLPVLNNSDKEAPDWTCMSCKENPVTHMTGCRHFLCLACVEKLRTPNNSLIRCVTCRTVSAVIKPNFIPSKD